MVIALLVLGFCTSPHPPGAPVATTALSALQTRSFSPILAFLPRAADFGGKNPRNVAAACSSGMAEQLGKAALLKIGESQK